MRPLGLFTVLTMLFWSCYYPRGWHMMDAWNHRAWWGYGGAFMWLIFLVLIGVVVYFVVRGEKWMKHSSSEETALDILKKRYAKGEITKQEYERIKKELVS
jgi:putative membrane protein